MEIAIIIVFVVYILFSAYYSFKIYNTISLDRSKKLINILLTWILPFIWIYIFKDILLKTNPGSYEIEVKNNRSSSNFYESGAGRPGGGLGRF